MQAGLGAVPAGLRGRLLRSAPAGSRAGRCRESRPWPALHARQLGTVSHPFPSLRFAGRRRRGAGREECRGGRGGAARHSSARQRKTSRESGSVPRPAAPPLPGTGREAAAPARPRSPEVSAALRREGGGRRGAREARTAAGACPRVSRTGSGLMRGILLETDLFGSVL